MFIFKCLAIGLTIGCVSGALGIGGGVLLIPVMMWLLALDQPQAAGITLAILAVPVTLPGVCEYFRQDTIGLEHLKIAGWIALAFAVGTFLGAALQMHFDPSVLRLIFGLVMIYVAIRFIMASNSQVACAAAGLGAVALAWISFFLLRMLGRRHLAVPSLGDEIRRKQREGHDDIDYHI